MPVDLPPLAHQYIPVLVEEVCQNWPELPYPYYIGAQIEQETCISLKSKRCWSPNAELKTSREYGFGLGQLTVTQRFNNFNAAHNLASSLASWKWESRFDAPYQLRTLVLMNMALYLNFNTAATTKDQMAFMFASYNGGMAGTLNDSKMCGATKGCDKTRWFNNVEKTSLKTRIKLQGYGKSFFDINREYVYNIIKVRFVRYLSLLKSGVCAHAPAG